MPGSIVRQNGIFIFMLTPPLPNTVAIIQIMHMMCTNMVAMPCCPARPYVLRCHAKASPPPMHTSVLFTARIMLIFVIEIVHAFTTWNSAGCHSKYLSAFIYLVYSRLELSSTKALQVHSESCILVIAKMSRLPNITPFGGWGGGDVLGGGGCAWGGGMGEGALCFFVVRTDISRTCSCRTSTTI